MFCKKCGTMIPDNSAFCNICGTPTNTHVNFQQPNSYNPTRSEHNTQYSNTFYPHQPSRHQQNNYDAGKNFSIAGMIMGIISILGFWIPIFNFIFLVFGILGIVFSCMGRKKSLASCGRVSKYATAGLVLGIVGTTICSLSFITCSIAITAPSAPTSNPYYL